MLILHRKMPFARRMQALGLLGSCTAALALAACDSAASKPQAAISPAATEAPASTKTASQRKRRNATLRFDGASYEFDWVMCAPGAQGTTMLVASDQAKRASYPMLRVSVFPEQPADSVANTVSLDFQHAEPRILWLRHEASIEKTEDGLAASGTLQGHKMVKQADGRTIPVALATDSIREFSLDVTC